MKNEDGRSPSGPGSQASPEAASASSPSVSIPNALRWFAVCVQLYRYDKKSGTHLAWAHSASGGPRESAVGKAIEYARAQYPNYLITDVGVLEVENVRPDPKRYSDGFLHGWLTAMAVIVFVCAVLIGVLSHAQ